VNDVVAGGIVGASIAIICYGGWFTLYEDRKIKARGWLIGAAGFGLQLTVDVLKHEKTAASINAVGLAFALYGWWNNGGGDGMRRRFKAWVGSLGPRTAPQGA
jgi:hypothetical protein